MDTKDRFLSLVQSGDVIVQYPGPISGLSWYRRQVLKVVRAGIKWRQRTIFGTKGETNVIHVMQWFKDRAFSCEWPKANWFDIDHFINSSFVVLRYTQFNLEKRHLDTMEECLNSFVGAQYDYGQLIDIALNHVVHTQYHHSWFDIGGKNGVCSSVVRTAFETMIQSIEKTKYAPRLFDYYNPAYWSSNEISDTIDIKSKYGYLTPIEATTPAHFINSNLFTNCRFDMVASFI